MTSGASLAISSRSLRVLSFSTVRFSLPMSVPRDGRSVVEYSQDHSCGDFSTSWMYCSP
jgi:hypothetical protein